MFRYGFLILSISVQEFKKSVVWIGEIGVYNEIQISDIERNTNENEWMNIHGREHVYAHQSLKLNYALINTCCVFSISLSVCPSVHPYLFTY